MDKKSCKPSQVGQAGQGGTGGPDTVSDDRKPTGQAGTGQSGAGGRDPAEPKDYDSDPQAGGGRLDQINTDDAPAGGGDASSHGSR